MNIAEVRIKALLSPLPVRGKARDKTYTDMANMSGQIAVLRATVYSALRLDR